MSKSKRILRTIKEPFSDSNKGILLYKLSITAPLDQSMVNKILLNKNVIETIEYDDIVLSDFKYISRLTSILNIKHIFKLDIKKMYNLDIFKLLFIQNPNIIIKYGFEDVPIDKFIEVSEKLDSMVKPILQLDLSLLEKFLYIFNITTHIKEYKYKQYFENKGLSLFEVLNEDNDLIVCGGFAKILDELCKRVGISSTKYSLKISDEKGIQTHIRNIVCIDDNKYNICGMYISDPTFNNDLNNELYTTALMIPKESFVFDNNSIKSSFEVLLDFNSYDEFMNLIYYDYEYNDLLNFKDLINKLLLLREDIEFLNNIEDNTNYYSLYHNQEFISKLYIFLNNRFNKRIDKNILIEALINLKKKLNPNITEEDLSNYKENIISNYKIHYFNHFNIEINSNKNK